MNEFRGGFGHYIIHLNNLIGDSDGPEDKLAAVQQGPRPVY